MPLTLEQVRAAIRHQDMHWDAGPNPVGERLLRGGFQGFGLATRKGREPGGGRGKLTRQGFAFQVGPPPERVDWRDVDDRDFVLNVRDQRNCGACVAFATCAVLESRARIKKEDPHFELDLSEAHLFFCGAGSRGCQDGWYTGQALKRCREVGVGKEADFRYRASQLACREIPAVVKVPRWRLHSDSAARKKALVNRGPVIGGMVVYSDFPWYRGGVYRPTTSETVGLHAIAIIGYDDQDGYWLAKNSWGAVWGEGGFVRIGYGSCGIDSQFGFYDPEVEVLVGVREATTS